MRRRSWRVRLRALAITVAMMIVVTMSTSDSTVKAQTKPTGSVVVRPVVIVRPFHPFYRPFYPHHYWPPFGVNYYSHYTFRNSAEAEAQGYKDGFKTGKGDAKHQRSFDPERSHYYQEAGFGNFGEQYRAGFVRGYTEGFHSASDVSSSLTLQAPINSEVNLSWQ